MNDRFLNLILIGVGEPPLRLQERLECAATELGMKLQLYIEMHPAAVGPRYEQRTTMVAQGRCIIGSQPRAEEIVALLRAQPETKAGAHA